MSYLVSQLRKDDNAIYMSSVPVLGGVINSPNTFGQGTPFQDFRIINNNQSQEDASNNHVFIKGRVYYLRFKIKKIPYDHYQKAIDSEGNTDADRAVYAQADNLRITILLKNASQAEDEQTYMPQQIGTCTIYKNESEEDQFSSFVYVFSPLRNFDSIVFKIQRTVYDAIKPDGDYRKWLSEGNIFYSGQDGEVSELKNIVNKSNGWLKFGFQSRPGVLIIVNGEPIRVGRSGIYECNNGMKIESFMIASPNGTTTANIDAFLLDYAYNG